MKTICFFLFCWLFAGSLLHGQSHTDTLLNRPIHIFPQASPESVGMNPDTIAKIVQLIHDTPPHDFRGLVVIKDQKLVVEEYFHTYWRATIHDIRSAGKSITAMLLGIAIDKGLIQDVHRPVYDFFPDIKLTRQPTPAHRSITIQDLLKMSSGLDADADDGNSPGNAGNWVARTDWVNYALSLPMAFTTGEKWVYNDACAMLTGAIIEEVSGQKLADFAEENLFKPLGIEEYYWYTGNAGRTGAMGNLYVSTLDFAKLGLLVLNKGEWQGQQLISADWIHEMTQVHITLPASNPYADRYGYFWYIGEREVSGRNFPYTFASGNGGNVLFLVPEENLVMSLTSSAYGGGHRRTHNIINYVLRSLQ